MKLLDVCSGAGGASTGYARAGFDVTGVDNIDQPRYPFTFHQADAIEFIRGHGHEYDVIVGSPPCQLHSDLRTLAGPGHVDIIPQLRAAMIVSGKPYVIENVEGAPLHNPITLCGSMFDLAANGRALKRHRLFESNVDLMAPGPDACAGQLIGGVYGDGGGGPMTRGYKFYAAESREAMGIDWMNRAELSQSIPPDYTHLIGNQLMQHLTKGS